MKTKFTLFGREQLGSFFFLSLFLLMLIPSICQAETDQETGLNYDIDSKKEVSIKGISQIPDNGKIVIPATIDDMPVTSIAMFAFMEKTTLTSVTIPASVVTIGNAAFYKCTNLSEVVFAEGSKLSNIPEHAFDQTALSSITLPENITSIGDYAFNETALKKINIPAAVTTLGAYIFTDCKNLSEVVFAEGSKLTNIPDWAFYKTALSSINLPDAITSIGDNAFYETALEKINIPAAVTTFGESTFCGCKNLSEVVFAEGSKLTNIPDYAFVGTTLESINIPSSVISIGNHAFNLDPGNSTLKEVIFSKDSKLETIGDYAFAFASMKQIIIPASLKKLGNSAFSCCHKLREIIFEEGCQLTEIPEQAFFVDEKVSEVLIPAHVTTIAKSAFASTGLKKVTFAEGCKLSYIGEEAFSSTSLENLIIPETVITIDDKAFSRSNVKNVFFAENSKLSSIGDEAFSINSIETISLPSSVTSIGDEAFSKCDNLTSIYFEGTTPPKMGVDVFAKEDWFWTKPFKFIYVPMSYVDVFKSATSWEAYASFVKARTYGIDGANYSIPSKSYQAGEIVYSLLSETKEGDYSTFCMPFDINLEETSCKGKIGQVYELGDSIIHYTGNNTELQDCYVFKMKELNNKTIPAGTPFIVKWLANDNIGEIFHNDNPVKVGENGSWPIPEPQKALTVVDWDGVNQDKPIYEGIKISQNAYFSTPSSIKTLYSLYSSNSVVGFYHIDINDETLNPAFSWYLAACDNQGSPLSAPIQLRLFDLNTLTGIVHITNTENDAKKKKHGVFTLNGLKISNKSSFDGLSKGIYIIDGKKVVIK